MIVEVVYLHILRSERLFISLLPRKVSISEESEHEKTTVLCKIRRSPYAGPVGEDERARSPDRHHQVVENTDEARHLMFFVIIY